MNAGFSRVAILTLALAISATVAVYSVLDAALLRPLPYRDPARLVAIWRHGATDANISKVFLGYADFEDFSTKSTRLGNADLGSIPPTSTPQAPACLNRATPTPDTSPSTNAWRPACATSMA